MYSLSISLAFFLNQVFMNSIAWALPSPLNCLPIFSRITAVFTIHVEALRVFSAQLLENKINWIPEENETFKSRKLVVYRQVGNGYYHKCFIFYFSLAGISRNALTQSPKWFRSRARKIWPVPWASLTFSKLFLPWIVTKSLKHKHPSYLGKRGYLIELIKTRFCYSFISIPNINWLILN